MAGDVVIRYDFLPTESSIRTSAERVVQQFNKKAGEGGWGSGIYSEKYYKQLNQNISKSVGKVTNEFDVTTKKIIDLLRATQQKTSLQTKILSGMKFFGVGGGGAGGEGAGATAGAVGGGGGVMTALGIIAGLLVVISVAMTLISAFFDAVGPILKVVLKMFSAIILILLMPFLKRGLPVLFGILKWMIEMSKGISKFVDQFMTYMENLFGRALGGDPLAIIELIFGPMGMLGIFLIKKLVEFLASVDWNRVVTTLIPILQSAFDVVVNMVKSFAANLSGGIWNTIKSIVSFIKEALAPGGLWEKVKEIVNLIGTSIFGEETWSKVKEAIAIISNAFSPEGIWKSISDAIDYIGTEVFGEGVWETIKTSITDVNNLLTGEWAKIITTLQDIGTKLNAALVFIIDPMGPIKVWIAEELNKMAGGFFGPTATDFISRPGGGVQAFSPDDTIIGMKNPGAMGGVHITNNLNVSAGVDKNEFRKILAELNRQQARDLRTRTSYVGGVYA